MHQTPLIYVGHNLLISLVINGQSLIGKCTRLWQASILEGLAATSDTAEPDGMGVGPSLDDLHCTCKSLRTMNF